MKLVKKEQDGFLVLTFHCCCRSSGTMFISVYMTLTI